MYQVAVALALLAELKLRGQKATLGELVEEAVIDLAQKMGVRIA